MSRQPTQARTLEARWLPKNLRCLLGSRKRLLFDLSEQFDVQLTRFEALERDHLRLEKAVVSQDAHANRAPMLREITRGLHEDVILIRHSVDLLDVFRQNGVEDQARHLHEVSVLPFVEVQNVD